MSDSPSTPEPATKSGALPIQHPMVGWYDPWQLIQTGMQVLVSDTLGTRADYRVLESFAGAQGVFDYSAERELWLDFVADVGDGWNSTYAVASLLAAPVLDLFGPGDTRVGTRRGDILIMGGDEVYPFASRRAYQERTVVAYESALQHTHPPHPHLFAIPGNHDWYDGLVSFARLFFQRRWFGGWQTKQQRSYFALKLPYRWWLLGVDIHLESDIDKPQLDYFCQVAGQMQPGDRIILATAEPHWVYGRIYDPKLQNNLAFLEQEVIHKAQAKLQMVLAGDLHHYRRHESTDGNQVQLVTSGGGGAFLHSTYGPPVDKVVVGSPAEEFLLKSSFPEPRKCKWFLLRNAAFLFINPRFGILTGVVYLVLAWVLREPLQREPISPSLTFGSLSHAIRVLLQTPAAAAIAAAVIVGFIVFTDTHKIWYRRVAGTTHAFAHLASVFVVAWFAGWVAADHFGMKAGSSAEILTSAATLFAGGYILGPCIMGLYLYVSLRFFRRHSNEAFSSLRIEDYKNFLRLHIDADGTLTLFPIGVKKVPRKWKATNDQSGLSPKFVPSNGQSIQAELIEGPITLKRAFNK